MIAIWLVVAWGVLVWFGVYRSWARMRIPPRRWMLGVPWLALGLVVLQLLAAAHALGLQESDTVKQVVVCLALAVMLIGASEVAFEWPEWGKPPWYRRLQKLEMEAERGDRVEIA